MTDGNCESAETRNYNKTEGLVEYNHCKKQELNLYEQITKQDDMIKCKPVKLSNN